MNFDNQGIKGYDVSHHNDDNYTPQGIDFNKMKSNGANFVIIKAGQFYRLDTDFVYNWRSSKEAGIPRSAYWFGDYYADPKMEALAFWNAIKNDPAEGMYFIDYEYYGWEDWHKLYDFLFEFKRLSGLPSKKIGLYSGYYYWMEHRPSTITSQQWFAQFPLWLPWYSEESVVKVPPPWAECLIWQYGTPVEGLEAGVESLEIDGNIFNGGADKFLEYLGGTVTLPPTGETMATYKVKTTATPHIQIRETPNGTDIGDMFPDEVFDVDGASNDSTGRSWLHSIKVGKVGYVASWLCDLVSGTIPPPTVGLPSTLWIGETRETVVEYKKVA